MCGECVCVWMSEKRVRVEWENDGVGEMCRSSYYTPCIRYILGIVHLLRLYLIINYTANLYRIFSCLPVSIRPQYKPRQQQRQQQPNSRALVPSQISEWHSNIVVSRFIFPYSHQLQYAFGLVFCYFNGLNWAGASAQPSRVAFVHGIATCKSVS